MHPNNAKVVTKRSYGFRTYDGLKIALYHTLGDLPTPKAPPQILLRNRFRCTLVNLCADLPEEHAIL